MPVRLVARSGEDSLCKLEASARTRMQEAEALHDAGQSLGAVYLYGYVIEISLKAAYYRIIGLVPMTPIDKRLHRLPAEDAIKKMATLPAHPQGRALPGHNIIGWARLLEQQRATSGRTAFKRRFTRQLHNRMQIAFECWAEFLRYRANRPYDWEGRTMRESARWVLDHYKELWS